LIKNYKKCVKADATNFEKGLKGLIRAREIHKQMTTYINALPLHINDKTDRIHASLNLGPETGRLSCSNPNLQNQPKTTDEFNIRKAFIPAQGKKFIVADYSQLELRILALEANCEAMIKGFQSGGDFHSMTAMDVYKNVREAVEKGIVTKKDSHPSLPTIKTAFPTQRNHAKTLNFGIAYGQTPFGLKEQLDVVSIKQAEEIISQWYDARPEVLQWQNQRKREAIEFGHVYTKFGRKRVLFNPKDFFPKGLQEKLLAFNHHDRYLNAVAKGLYLDKKFFRQFYAIMRRAVNTPIQGGAADIVMMSMILLELNEELEGMGWKLLLMIHDEVILEGPEEHAERALEIVKEVMEIEHSDITFKIDASIRDAWG